MNEETLSLVKSNVKQILEKQKFIGESQDYSRLYVDIVEVANILGNDDNLPGKLKLTERREICYLWMILARSSYRMFHQSRPRCKDYIDLSVELWGCGLKYAEGENEIDCLKEYGTALLARNDSFAGFSDLSLAAELMDKLLFLLPEGHPYIPESLNLLGLVLNNRFESTGNTGDLELAIDSIRKALEVSLEGRDDISNMLDNLGNALEARFDTKGNMEDLDEAVLFKRRAVMLTPDDDSALPGRMTNLGNALKSTFDMTGDIIHLEESIALRRRSLELAKDGNPHIARIHNNLGSSLIALFKERGNRKDLEEAIYSYQKSIELTPDGHPDLPRMLSNLGSALTTHYGYTADIVDLEQALNCQKKSVALLPDEHPDISSLLNSFSNSLLTMFDCNGDIKCLEEAITIQFNIVNRTPDNHPEMPGRLSGLANALHIRFNHTGNTNDLETALTSIKRSVELSPAGHPELPNQFHNLGLILRSKFTITGSADDLDASVQAATKSVELVSDTHLNRPVILGNLANVLLSRFETTGNRIDLERAVSASATAVELTQEGHLDMPERLSAYAIALLTQFEHTADMDVIERAVHTNEMAISITPNNHPNLQKWWGAHGHALIKRFEVGGNTEDIDQAIHSYKMTIELTPEGHVDLPGKLTNLSIALQIRANHRSDVDNLRHAILLARRAVELTPKGHTVFPSMLNNLGTALLDKYERTKDDIDLEESILVKGECVQLVSEDDPQMPRLLNNLGKALQLKYDVHGDVNDLKDALTMCENALNLLKDGHPLKIMCHISTGEILGKLGLLEQDLDYMRRSSLHFKASIVNAAYPSHVRVYAAQLWGKSHNSLGRRDQDIMNAFSIAFSLLPQVIPLTYTIGHRYDRLKVIQGLGISACTVAITHGEYQIAVEWSDQSRGIFWTQIHHLRSPIESVYKVNPRLADKLKSISLLLQSTTNRGYANNGLPSPQEIINLEADTRKHNALVEEWEQHIQQARSYVGLENLLLPTPYSEMVKYIPPDGKVIIVNVGRRSSDALVISNDASPEIVHIPLPTFTHKLAELLRRQLYAALMSDGTRTRMARAGRPVSTKSTGNLRQILSTLWRIVVEPIFQGIGIMQNDRSSKSLHRIWWCPTGPLTFLPIHAAGIYREDTARNGSIISNYAVSSYIPTISALMNLNRNTNNKMFRGMLAVSQANHPDLPELPATVLECESIHHDFSDRGYSVRHVDGEEATRTNILELMEKYNWIHLSCHGSQELLTPTDSAFYLHGENLNLMDIIRKDITDADFAFLSACQTASGTPQLSSEAVHLAAGMLAAGYRSVVATFWSIDDEHALFITKEFYRYLLNNVREGGILDSSYAADALQYATFRLRETLGTSEESLMSWVPYVHIGL